MRPFRANFRYCVLCAAGGAGVTSLIYFSIWDKVSFHHSIVKAKSKPVLALIRLYTNSSWATVCVCRRVLISFFSISDIMQRWRRRGRGIEDGVSGCSSHTWTWNGIEEFSLCSIMLCHVTDVKWGLSHAKAKIENLEGMLTTKEKLALLISSRLNVEAAAALHLDTHSLKVCARGGQYLTNHKVEWHFTFDHP